eukprot:gene12140-25478_t
MGNTSPNREWINPLDFISKSGFPVGAVGVQGLRPSMEDAHIIVELANSSNSTLLCIFDGHGGAGAANFAANNFSIIFESNSSWQTYINDKNGQYKPELIIDALKESFLELDDQIRIEQYRTQFEDRSGSTAVCTIITPRFIICANAGDSRCVLGTHKKTLGLSLDHKPNNDEEKKRIENAGGKIKNNRVDGDLAVARGLGDFKFKSDRRRASNEQKIIANPGVIIHERNEHDDVLIMACDGLWDVISSTAAVNFVRKRFIDPECNILSVAESVVNLALKKGSSDNVSVIVVKLKGHCSTPLSISTSSSLYPTLHSEEHSPLFPTHRLSLIGSMTSGMSPIRLHRRVHSF